MLKSKVRINWVRRVSKSFCAAQLLLVLSPLFGFKYKNRDVLGNIVGGKVIEVFRVRKSLSFFMIGGGGTLEIPGPIVPEEPTLSGWRDRRRWH